MKIIFNRWNVSFDILESSIIIVYERINISILNSKQSYPFHSRMVLPFLCNILNNSLKQQFSNDRWSKWNRELKIHIWALYVTVLNRMWIDSSSLRLLTGRFIWESDLSAARHDFRVLYRHKYEPDTWTCTSCWHVVHDLKVRNADNVCYMYYW